MATRIASWEEAYIHQEDPVESQLYVSPNDAFDVLMTLIATHIHKHFLPEGARGFPYQLEEQARRIMENVDERISADQRIERMAQLIKNAQGFFENFPLKCSKRVSDTARNLADFMRYRLQLVLQASCSDKKRGIVGDLQRRIDAALEHGKKGDSLKALQNLQDMRVDFWDVIDHRLHT